jgi:hypothetical protein
MKRFPFIALCAGIAGVSVSPVALSAWPLTSEMTRELTAQIIKHAGPASAQRGVKQCIAQASGVQNVADAKEISLNTSNNAKQYLISGTGLSCLTGNAGWPMFWVFETRNGNLRMLADIGTSGTVERSSRQTKGYHDLIVSFSTAAEQCTLTYKFNGKVYRKQHQHCKKLM